MQSPWLRIGGTLMLGMFISYIDRTNLSVTLKDVAQDLGFSGAGFATTSSLVLTAFLIGYIVANISGGIFTTRFDPKTIAIGMMALWSLATLTTGLVSSVAFLVACRFVLGVAEGIYWPQQSRFVRLWFSPAELTRANSLIHYYGQFLALGLGFIILTPLHNMMGWRNLFFLCGGIGLLVMVPLYARVLLNTRDAPLQQAQVAPRKVRLTREDFGGMSFVLLIITYLTQGMLFWGITLWIPMVVTSLGFTGWSQAFASALPYLLAVLLAIPMSWLSDKTGKRILIAALGLLIPGAMLLLLPWVESAVVKMTLITLAMGYYASSFTPNIWSIIQSSVRPHAVGAASGIVNGIGAGGGGTLAGFMVAILYARTGSYMSGFTLLGALVIIGGISLLSFGWWRQRHPVSLAQVAPF
ncbi:MFS transporter [Pantoea phytobeneficialis]|uniref:MFS transporter n=1 Tax=Pantoea phytobeneficialis TaxID=2052056 RepID=A0AAP9KSB7_9GAMM|nr:MFS transporter [Pantoea phytobeneficialis]MDO6406979.1 MFS transporter [Pantoea phytobeneficialis]QGR09944.1 MFS transporter [Pantoea phytobeneficialis]